ncbi:MAG TPA: hypothetical protein VGR28_14995 [Candidatus Thermoplasmatota archaeon]|jgi:hypothetical protein|nr:hypothetical protein [Candidatus Thermoplasmatota archaeon]
MDGPGLLRAGIALSVVGILLSLATSLTIGSGLDAATRPLGGLATLFGLFLLILALYAIAGLPRMPALVLAGSVLFVGGRLLSTALGNVLTGAQFGDPGVQLTFALLTVASNLGTILLFVGIFRALRDRVPAQARAPPAAPAGASPAPARPSAIRPPRAPLPTRPLERDPPR